MLLCHFLTFLAYVSITYLITSKNICKDLYERSVSRPDFLDICFLILDPTNGVRIKIPHGKL